MDGWIDSLSGFFDGYKFHQGPISIRLAQGKIDEIITGVAPEVDFSGKGKILSPPFVDGHTHLIFGGTRFKELGLKLAGQSYSQILEQGGGIQSTVTATRSATNGQLRDLVLQRLDTMMSHGTLVTEAKSGYGLSTEHEIRLLQVLNDVNKHHDVTVHPTFGAAHVIPTNRSREEYVAEIIDEMLPKVVDNNLATSIDVFCDKGAFTVEETLQIFDAATDAGLPPRVHADEIQYTGIAKITAERYDLLSADHLLQATEDDFSHLAQNNAVAMFMPLAPFGLFSNDLPHGFDPTEVTIGLGSDFNPNNWALSMQSAIRMAVYRYKMTPLQAMRAATSGSYQGITGKLRHQVDEGSPATFILLQATTLSELASKFGQNLVSHVFKNSQILRENTAPVA